MASPPKRTVWLEVNNDYQPRYYYEYTTYETSATRPVESDICKVITQDDMGTLLMNGINIDHCTLEEIDDHIELSREIRPSKEYRANSDIEAKILQHKVLNGKLQQLMKTNAELRRLLLNLLESVEAPDGTKFLKPTMVAGGGEEKKAMLDLFNLLLSRAGLPPCPGALGEIVYNDLFRGLRDPNVRMDGRLSNYDFFKRLTY